MGDQSLEMVISTILEVLTEQGHAPVALDAKTNILHDTPLDSMGLAIVVMRLEDKTGNDPFVGGFINFHTVGELAALYGR